MGASGEQQLRERIVSILWSDACSRIAFNVDGTMIASASFLWAAHYISANKVSISVKPQKKGAGASYIASSNTLSFPHMNYGLNSTEQMDIVHECTHIWIDSTKKKTYGIVNEMCAYISGGTFLEVQGIPTPNSSIRRAAQLVAKLVVSGADLNQPPALTSVIKLRYAILGNPLYDYLEKDRAYDYGQDGIV